MTKKPKGWYKELVIRPVLPVDGYESYEKICGLVAEFYFTVDEEKVQKQLVINHRESRYISLFTLLKVGQAKCPAYWVGKDLLTALIQSDLTIEADNLHWAMKTGIFMLPKGVIYSPENRSVDAIYWHYDTATEFLYWAATDGESFFCRRYKMFDNTKKFKYSDVKDFDPELVVEFNEYLQSIFLRLLLIMECRSELVDTTSEVIRVNKGFGKEQAKDYYEPLWIGREYRFQREDSGEGGGTATHSSKSVHWRRGFLRNQAYGQGRQQRKLLWIEPVLVMGGKEIKI